jgi:glucose-1-phosphate cytidylyltransferase
MTDMMWEDEPLEKLTEDNQLSAYRHTGFWKPMDALRDRIELESLWKNNQAKWKLW